MANESQLIFVTGASGFLGSHIIQELLEQGYRVRASARGKKLEPLRSLYKQHPSVEIVEIADIAHGNFSEILQGVNAVIHTACPLPGRVDAETLLETATEGSVNVLEQARKAGVKKFIVTSTVAVLFGDPNIKGVALRAEHWTPLTKEHVTPDNPGTAYTIAKKYAELAVWEWADAHPETDVTTFCPSFLYGPFSPLHLPIAPGDYDSLSSNINIYNLLSETGSFPIGPSYVHVHDIAKAHVNALRTPSSVEGRKRIIFSSPHGLNFQEVLDLIKNERPDVEGRLIKKPVPPFPFDRLDLDFARIEEVTGMKKSDFVSTNETIMASVDALLCLEESWKEAGYIVPKMIPTLL